MIIISFTGWLEVEKECELHYSKVEVNGSPQFERSLIVKKDFTWNLYYKEHKIPSDSDVCSSIPRNLFCLSSCKLALYLIDSFSLCLGNTDEKFRPLAEQRKGLFTDTSGKP